jgi:hypothetical protein
MKTVVSMAIGLAFIGSAHGQVGTSISADGTPPNTNAMLDVQSPATGAGKGILIPRVTQSQRTFASADLAGGLLDNAGNLRGGAAQGLLVYQTDGAQGLYFNSSLTAAPTWVYLGTSTTNYLPLAGGTMRGALNLGGQIVTNAVYFGDGCGLTNIDPAGGGFTERDPVWSAVSNSITTDIASRLLSNVWAAAGSTTNYLARTGGTMSGALNLGGQVVTNATYYGDGRGLTNLTGGAYPETDPRWSAVSNSITTDIASRLLSNVWAAAGSTTNYLARTGGTMSGALNLGGQIVTNVAHVDFNGNYVSVGRGANGSSLGAALGYLANSANAGAAVGNEANGAENGTAIGCLANAFSVGAVVGESADGTNYGAAVGYSANGCTYGAAIGRGANGYEYGSAIGYNANGHKGVALGYKSYAPDMRVAIGVGASSEGLADGETIAIGYNVTNSINYTARIRGTLYLDGGTGINYRATFGSGSWSNKAFEIDHPLDPQHKILRHFCLEGPQVWNVYAGNAQLVNGQATVQLPDYYTALNLVGSEIYSLTPVGGRADIWVQEEVRANRFLIQGEKDLKVSWTIKVLRNDPGCREDLKRRPVEQMKSEIK